MARALDLEPMLIPRAHVLAVRALLAGHPADEPLWKLGDDDEDGGESDDGGA